MTHDYHIEPYGQYLNMFQDPIVYLQQIAVQTVLSWTVLYITYLVEA